MNRNTIIFLLMAFSSCYAHRKDDAMSRLSYQKRQEIFEQECSRDDNCCNGCLGAVGTLWAASAAIESTDYSQQSQLVVGSAAFAAFTLFMLRKTYNQNKVIARLKQKTD